MPLPASNGLPLPRDLYYEVCGYLGARSVDSGAKAPSVIAHVTGYRPGQIESWSFDSARQAIVAPPPNGESAGVTAVSGGGGDSAPARPIVLPSSAVRYFVLLAAATVFGRSRGQLGTVAVASLFEQVFYTGGSTGRALGGVSKAAVAHIASLYASSLPALLAALPDAHHAATSFEHLALWQPASWARFTPTGMALLDCGTHRSWEDEQLPPPAFRAVALARQHRSLLASACYIYPRFQFSLGLSPPSTPSTGARCNLRACTPNRSTPQSPVHRRTLQPACMHSKPGLASVPAPASNGTRSYLRALQTGARLKTSTPSCLCALPSGTPFHQHTVQSHTANVHVCAHARSSGHTPPIPTHSIHTSGVSLSSTSHTSFAQRCTVAAPAASSVRSALSRTSASDGW